LAILTSSFELLTVPEERHLESMLGKAKVHEKQKKYDLALETLSEIAIQNANFFPALLEKTKIHMVNGDWE
jgi:hypothetical protein